MKKVTITKIKLAGANLAKKGNGLVLVEENVLCYVPNKLVALIDSYEIESVEFEETPEKTESGISLGKQVKINESEIGKTKLEIASLGVKLELGKLKKEFKEMEI